LWGGAVVSLYADSDFSDSVRPTYDIDIAVDLITYSDQVTFQEKFQRLGFHPDITSNTLVRYQFNNIQVDLMSTSSTVLGESNSWYKPGFENRIYLKLGRLNLPILPIEYYLATKFEAFNNRGFNYLTSKDFEDIIYLLNYNNAIVESVKSTNVNVKEFLVSEFLKVTGNKNYPEIVEAHLDYKEKEKRFTIVQERLMQITTIY